MSKLTVKINDDDEAEKNYGKCLEAVWLVHYKLVWGKPNTVEKC